GALLDGPGAAIGDDFFEIRDQPFAVLEGGFGFLDLVLKADLQPFVQIAGHLEALSDYGGVELHFRKDGRVVTEKNLRAAAPRGPDLFGSRKRLPLLEPLLPLGAIAPDGGDQLLRQRIHDAGTHTVKAARGFVIAVVEFSARMQDGENHLERALLAGR